MYLTHEKNSSKIRLPDVNRKSTHLSALAQDTVQAFHVVLTSSLDQMALAHHLLQLNVLDEAVCLNVPSGLGVHAAIGSWRVRIGETEFG